MVKRLTTHGNSSALIIEKPILELLGIGPETLLEIATDGRNLIVSPVREANREKKIQEALRKINRRHGKTLKALAK
jgi:antitoxin component of MazEF toxin-antitoxin module